jgi:phage N-6-adenine-methyltransferase
MGSSLSRKMWESRGVVNNVHFSSANQGWETPAHLVDLLKPLFKFDLDVCAMRPNVCDRFISPEQDGLKTEWSGRCWMNPPYGRVIGKWVRRAASVPFVSGQSSCEFVLCLLPARPDTIWWQENIKAASIVCFLRGRLRFGSDDYWAWRWSMPTINGKRNSLYRKIGRKQSAPFPSALVVFSLYIQQEWLQALHGLGWTIVGEDWVDECPAGMQPAGQGVRPASEGESHPKYTTKVEKGARC